MIVDDDYGPSRTSGGCLSLRRSNRIRGRDNGDARPQRTGVWLFQTRSGSDGNFNGNDKGNDNDKGNGNGNGEECPSAPRVVPSDDDKPSVVGSGPAEKRVTRSSSRIRESDASSTATATGTGTGMGTPTVEIDANARGTNAEPRTRQRQQRRRGKTTIAATPSRGTNAIPVTPEPLPSSEDAEDAYANANNVANNVAKATRSSSQSRSQSQSPTKASRGATETKSGTKRKAAATPEAKKKKTKKKAAETATWPVPDGWRETYELVRELRQDKTAPCDSMGAEALVLPPPPPSAGDVANEERAKTARFQTLIALMLSSQTKDAMVDQAMGNLRDTSDGSGGLTVASILAMEPDVLNTKIYSVGFRNNKTKYIKQVARILHDEYNSDVPPTADEMIRNLPGVGPKMAYIVENICWNRQTGIGVDTHMHRLFPKLGWVSSNTKNPEHTRKQLESWLPHEFWGEVNLLWVGFGQEVQQEKQKALRKALKSSRPIDALGLLHSVEFDIAKEWELMLSLASSNLEEEEIKGDFPWRDDKEREQMNEMIQEVSKRISKSKK